MDLLLELGTLAFASRLKRLSDFGMQGTLDVYKFYNVDFEPRFFPLFYYLSQKGEASIMELAENLNVTHPAIIQIAKDLEKKGFIISKKSAEDARKRNLKLSKKGKTLLPILQKIWAEIRAMNDEIIDKREHNIMIAIKEIEDVWAEKNYLERFKEFHKIM
ncbi:MarR family transcriptional regulator [Arcicella sp. LKC2W]|uniref:MarR family winged helix-turn-helix transcriptional regulator n=1 Tax=Arcicella sp. LKC2W TaxID=2984198 RepID=UPI002B215C09|nr:MarR family transcriptional regulator [Arcicella sp. LKC2W]MEA5461955.1 MarR family transcriptional regulator [Arcicella sp. LKC2W]